MEHPSPSTPRRAPIRRVTVVVNPERRDAADDLLAALGDDADDFEVVHLRDAEELTDAVAGAVASGAEVVAAVGGDGTQSAAASVLRGSGTALLVVPGGTVNLLGKVLGIESVDDAVRALRDGRTRTLDVGVLDGEPFVLNATTGFDAEVIHEVDDGAKRLGLLGYLLTGVRRLRAHRPRDVTVRVDGGELHRGTAMSVVVTNVAERGSTRFRLAPEATPDDGRLDVVVQRCSSVRSMLRASVALLRGRRPRSEDVVHGQGTEIEVRWRGSVWSQRDGDAVGTGSVFRHTVEARSLSVHVVDD